MWSFFSFSFQSPKDRNHLRSAGGKVSLPKELSKMIHPETKSKDDGFNLLSAFQGLSFSTAALTQSKHSKAPTPTHGESCRVMWSAPHVWPLKMFPGWLEHLGIPIMFLQPFKILTFFMYCHVFNYKCIFRSELSEKKPWCSSLKSVRRDKSTN